MAQAEDRQRPVWRWLATALACAALASWPLAYHYTSFGLDLERLQDGRVCGTFYRWRWPGDGSLTLARLVEHREPGEHRLEPCDLGGSFWQPAPDLAAEGFWQRHGFWWVVVGPTSAAVPPIVAGADRALLVGVPHWLLVLATVAAAVRLHVRAAAGRRRRTT